MYEGEWLAEINSKNMLSRDSLPKKHYTIIKMTIERGAVGERFF